MELAPIGVSAYNRLWHLQQTIEALQENELSRESELFIFSDAPKPGDEEKVARVRKYIHRIGGFKDVTIFERNGNSRVKNNREGIRYLLEKYGRIIFLEEDIVSAPDFLNFMNQALDFYEHDKRIISISGYSPPISIHRDYKKDIYLSYRFSAWGFGIWKDRYDLIDFKLEGIDKFLSNKKQLREFCRGGNDMLPMLKKEAEGALDALDVKIFYTQYKRKMFTIYPTVSKTKNIGFDNTGLHCDTTDKYDVRFGEIKRVFSFDENIQIDDRIMRSNYEFRRIPLIVRIKDLIKTGIKGTLLG